jgi:twitching motility protein PilU
MAEKRASDLFFTSYAPVKIKIDGQIYPVNKQVLTPDMVREAAYGMMTEEQIRYFEELEIDFALSQPGTGPIPSGGFPSARLSGHRAPIRHSRYAKD